MISFYFVCKNGHHEHQTQDEIVERFEIDTDYAEGLKMLRCIVNVFKDWVKVSRMLGRTK